MIRTWFAFALLLAAAAWFAAAPVARAQQVAVSQAAPILSPKYVSGRFYMLGRFQSQTQAAAVPTVDTVVHLYPFTVDWPFAMTTLNTRVITGVANCEIKVAVWLDVNGRPSGTPIVGSNTGQACATTGSNTQVSATYTFQPGVMYWVGSAVQTGASTFVGLTLNNGTSTYAFGSYGRSALNNTNTTGLSAPFTYTNNIMTLDLTSATFTDAGNGIPVIFGGN